MVRQKPFSIPFTLKAPKTYYEIGDVEYDANYKPTGIVFWVNPSNIKGSQNYCIDHILKNLVL